MIKYDIEPPSVVVNEFQKDIVSLYGFVWDTGSILSHILGFLIHVNFPREVALIETDYHK